VVNQGNDTVVIEDGDTGSADGERDTISGITTGDIVNVSDFGDLKDDFGLASGDTLTQNAGALAADGSTDIYLDTTNDRLVIETADDGSSVTTQEINVGVASGASVSSNGDGLLTFGTVPLSVTTEGTTVTVEGENPSTGSPVRVDLGGQFFDSNNNTGDGTNSLPSGLLNVDGANFASANNANGLILVGTDGNNQLIGAGSNDVLDGNDGSDVLTGSGGNDSFTYRAESELDGDTLDLDATGNDRVLLDIGGTGSVTATGDVATGGVFAGAQSTAASTTTLNVITNAATPAIGSYSVSTGSVTTAIASGDLFSFTGTSATAVANGIGTLTGTPTTTLVAFGFSTGDNNLVFAAINNTNDATVTTGEIQSIQVVSVSTDITGASDLTGDIALF
jgi:hypothetical protein